VLGANTPAGRAACGPACATYARVVEDPETPTEIAYYYPEPYWLAHEGGWVKSLLLFFDEIAILLPSYMRGRHLLADPTLAGPVEERGLLRVLEPETFVDEGTATELTAVIEALVDEEVFGALSEVGSLAELSMSRMGYGTLRAVANRISAKLQERGLATESEDGVSIPMHPEVRSAYLLILAQLARATGARQGLDLHPVTNGREAGSALRHLLELKPMPSRGHIVDFDLASALVGPPVAPSLDVFARSVAEIGRADDEDLEALGSGLVASPRTGRDAHRVPLLELDDLVVELHPPAPAQDQVHLLLRPVRVAVRKSIAGRDALVAEAGLLELERPGGHAELQVRRAVEVGADILQVLLDIPERERHGGNPTVPRRSSDLR